MKDKWAKILEDEELMDWDPGLKLYIECISLGEAETRIVEGREQLRIYRGLELHKQRADDSESGNDYTLCLDKPGVDWTPIKGYAKDNYSRFNNKNGEPSVLLSAWIPTDDKSILEMSIEEHESLCETDWGEYENRKVEKLSDGLFVYVSEDKYDKLSDLDIMESIGEYVIKK